VHPSNKQHVRIGHIRYSPREHTDAASDRTTMLSVARTSRQRLVHSARRTYSMLGIGTPHAHWPHQAIESRPSINCLCMSTLVFTLHSLNSSICQGPVVVWRRPQPAHKAGYTAGGSVAGRVSSSSLEVVVLACVAQRLPRQKGTHCSTPTVCAKPKGCTCSSACAARHVLDV